MKIIVIGDTHGHDSWKDIVNNEEYDLVVFLGDYLDSFSVRPETIANNLEDIIEFKRNNKDKVILLWGNHDHSYAFNEQCSGFNELGELLYCPILNSALKENLFDIIFIYDDIIMSHAGISEYWLKNVAKLDDVKNINWNNINPKCLNWNSLTGYDGYGDTISQSPIWIRPYSLNRNKIKNYRQIVGHTAYKHPTIENDVWYNDMMPNYYITITDGIIKFTENKYCKNKKNKINYTGSHDIAHCYGTFCTKRDNCRRYIAHLHAKENDYNYLTYLVINENDINEDGCCSSYWEIKREDN